MTTLQDRYDLGNLIDTYALGHYARVFEATDTETGRQVAFKLMRAEHLSPDGSPRWEAEAFLNETDLLLALADLPAVMKLYSCGYLASTAEHPAADSPIRDYGADLDAFRENFYPSLGEGWRPFLVLEYLPRGDNLLYVMRSSGGETPRRLPTEEGLDLAWQFGNLLYRAHERNIVFLDHKLEHAYWNGEQLRVIDWNSSKRVGIGGAPSAPQKTNDVHNLCVGILYPIFTGQAPQKGSLRPQPGSQSEVEARYEGITSLDFSTAPTLSHSIQIVLERGARKDITTASEFLEALGRVAARFGWTLPNQTANPALIRAREQTRIGLAKLRDSHAAARQAREYLLHAATTEGINEDMEAELRRLLTEIGSFLNARVIP